MFVSVALLGCFVLAEKDLRAGVQPGHVRPDYETFEEVRSHENGTTTEKAADDERLLREAILDVAYYLRRFKFSGRDPRRPGRGAGPKQNFYVEFPTPPLRNIHWEVKKNCEPSLAECVKYLQERVRGTVLPRQLDSLTMARQKGWSFLKDGEQIRAADEECLRRLARDGAASEAFSGPVQKFRWLTSASYYMCWYTMKEAAALRAFSEDCDDFASCIPWEAGLGNRDVRGDNRRPFACASYSFCPDPCCPLKHLRDWSACREASPCGARAGGDEACKFTGKNNVDFESLVLNRWNVSCKCDRPGTRWDSRSGTCVDVDECAEPDSPCDRPAESCRNLPGSYLCACSVLGYRGKAEAQGCEPDPVVQRVLHPAKVLPPNDTESYLRRFGDLLGKLKRANSRSLRADGPESNETAAGTNA